MFSEQRVPHMVVNDRDWLARSPVIVANGRWVPPIGFELPDSYGSWVGLCDGRPALAWVGPDDAVGLEPQGVDAWFERMTSKHGGLEVGRRVDRSTVGPGLQECATICIAISRPPTSSGSATGTWPSWPWWGPSIDSGFTRPPGSIPTRSLIP